MKFGKSLSNIVISGDQATYLRAKNEITIKEAFSKGVKIIDARKFNRNLTEDIISFIITDLSNSLNVGKNFSTYQVIELTLQIVKDYSYLSLEELIVVFENFKRGRYGKLYDRLDAQIIHEIIQKYEGEERAALLEEVHSKIKQTEKQELREKGIKGNFVTIAIGSSHPSAIKLRDHLKGISEKSKEKLQAVPAHLKSIQHWQTENEKLLPSLIDVEILQFREGLIKGILMNPHNANYKALLEKVEDELKIRKERLINSLPEIPVESLRTLLIQFKKYKLEDIQIILRDEIKARQENKS